MNSNQRRKDKRKWRYSVRYRYDSFSHDNYDEMWDWCVATFGNHSNRIWREKHGHIGDYWQFETEQAYLAFILRFGASDYEQ